MTRSKARKKARTARIAAVAATATAVRAETASWGKRLSSSVGASDATIKRIERSETAARIEAKRAVERAARNAEIDRVKALFAVEE